MKTMLTAAKAAKQAVAKLTTAEKNAALFAMADSLIACTDAILDANRQDLSAAQDTISTVMLDRLLNITDVPVEVFFDGSEPHWAAQAAANLAASGVISGAGAGSCPALGAFIFLISSAVNPALMSLDRKSTR